MKEILDGLWKEYYSEKCAAIETEEERRLARNVTEARSLSEELLMKDQAEAFDAYSGALYRMQDCFLKKAFFMGCEFAISLVFGSKK